LLPIILTVVALVLVLEGIIPFLSPRFWRFMLIRFINARDRGIRLVGLMSLLAGTALMVLVHSGIIFK
jgi:uncharacterized protein